MPATPCSPVATAHACPWRSGQNAPVPRNPFSPQRGFSTCRSAARSAARAASATGLPTGNAPADFVDPLDAAVDAEHGKNRVTSNAAPPRADNNASLSRRLRLASILFFPKQAVCAVCRHRRRVTAGNRMCAARRAVAAGMFLICSWRKSMQQGALRPLPRHRPASRSGSGPQTRLQTAAGAASSGAAQTGWGGEKSRWVRYRRRSNSSW